eukprot:GSMAST32.ASY1.ANO1.341.1 assembled CDS
MIRTFMYLGDRHDALGFKKLKQIGITHILNVTRDIPCYHVRFILFFFSYEILIAVDDAVTQNIKPHFLKAIEFICNVRQTQGKVLVHCRAGVSRSASCCLAYMCVFISIFYLHCFFIVNFVPNKF